MEAMGKQYLRSSVMRRASREWQGQRGGSGRRLAGGGGGWAGSKSSGLAPAEVPGPAQGASRLGMQNPSLD